MENSKTSGFLNLNNTGIDHFSSTLTLASNTLESPEIQENKLWKAIYKGDLNEHHLKEIRYKLGLINLCWENEDTQWKNQYPESYWTITSKEKLLLWLTENFRQQFFHNFPNRRPLLLACNNECGIQKMVCTTIRPTSLKYAELQTYSGCASFVADHVRYMPLSDPTELPEQLLSPGEILRRQAGHCFELATLLVSLLLGASYNAFVVSGYATREICINDTSRCECPYLASEQKVDDNKGSVLFSKYTLEPPRDLRSQFLLSQQNKEKTRETAARLAQKKAEERAIKDFELSPPDPLWTHRRHAWVLVLPSKDLLDACFLEPASGAVKRPNDPEYHGIDSVWNNINYWVAAEKSRLVRCQNLRYELDDLTLWQHLLLNETANDKVKKRLDMPSSWVSKIRIPYADFERRYVNGRKTVRYRKCSVELFAPYSDSSGLTQRVTHFSDYDCLEVRQIQEAYSHRADRLYFVVTLGHSVHHRFLCGRGDALKEHWFKAVDYGFPPELCCEFYFNSRQDGLLKFSKEPYSMTEDFLEREDLLYHRQVFFGDPSESLITKIIEKYHRNLRKLISEDPAVMEYDLKEGKVRITYHYGENQISTGTIELCLKNLKQTARYDPSPGSTPLRPLALYNRLQDCASKLQLAQEHVRRRQDEIKDMMEKRARESASPTLLISPFDEERNQEAREKYKERDLKLRKKAEQDLSLEVDLLAPYLAAVTSTPEHMDPLPASDAHLVYTKCLHDWKTLLIDRAIDIQARFDQLCREIKESSQISDCKDKQLQQLHSLQVRLMRHKELAPQRYLAIDACLRVDKRLVNAFR